MAPFNLGDYNLDEELDDEFSPYSSVSTRDPIADVSPMAATPANPAIKAMIQKRSGIPAAPDYSSEPLMQQYKEDQKSMDELRKAKIGSDYIANLGQAFSQLARGVNPPADNSSLYQGIQKQSEGLMKSGEEDMDRRVKVMNAIQSKKFKNEENDLRRQDLRARQNASLQAKLEKEAEKRAEKELTLNVPGFQRTGEVLPKAEEAAKLRNATATAEQLTNKLGRLRELVDQVGSFEYGGEAGQEMETLATEIQLLSKNQDMYNLGVLTGPDMGLLQKITADPASMSSLFTRDSTRKKQIETQLNSIQDKLNSTAKSMGYRRDQSSTQGSISSTQKPKRVTQNGHTYILNEETGEYE